MRSTALLVVVTLALGGCADQGALYQASIRDTAVYTPAHVHHLIPLAYPVQAANLTSYTGWADGKVGQAVTLTRDIWITVEPEVRHACQRFPQAELVPALHQLLGLKPATPADEAKKFVVLTVDAEQPVGPTGKGIFRPCANPDPSATTCGNDLQGPDTYARWFATQVLGSYRASPEMADTGYPWTRLGYTWNWDAASADHRGPQEYVVPAGSQVTIRGIVPPADYCRPAI